MCTTTASVSVSLSKYECVEFHDCYEREYWIEGRVLDPNILVCLCWTCECKCAGAISTLLVFFCLSNVN